MNRFMTISLASVLGAATFAGAASAAVIRPTDEISVARSADAQAVAFNRTTGADQTIRNWQGGRFDVVRVSALDDAGLKGEIRTNAQTEPRRVARLQSAIEQNRRLADRLKTDNVEIGNIVAARTALDGGITFYVR